MRLWSLHPRYLDAKGLVALWRQALLAREVLRGPFTGYRNHPQLARFRKQIDPLSFLNRYLFQFKIKDDIKEARQAYMNSTSRSQ